MDAYTRHESRLYRPSMMQADSPAVTRHDIAQVIAHSVNPYLETVKLYVERPLPYQTYEFPAIACGDTIPFSAHRTGPFTRTHVKLSTYSATLPWHPLGLLLLPSGAASLETYHRLVASTTCD